MISAGEKKENMQRSIIKQDIFWQFLHKISALKVKFYSDIIPNNSSSPKNLQS